MKDIIDQIIQIDSFAYENKNKYEEFLSNKKQEYENIMASYKKEKLDEAQKHVHKLNEETEAFILENEKLHKEKILKISAEMENIYQKAENELMQKIFNKMFILEG